MSRHQTLDPHVKRSVLWLKSQPYVTKIVIGISECCRHKYAPGYLKFKTDVDAGIKLNGYSGKGVTDLFVKIDPISERDSVKLSLSLKFK